MATLRIAWRSLKTGCLSYSFIRIYHTQTQKTFCSFIVWFWREKVSGFWFCLLPLWFFVCAVLIYNFITILLATCPITLMLKCLSRAVILLTHCEGLLCLQLLRDVRISESIMVVMCWLKIPSRGHEACRVMQNSYPEWRNFHFAPNNHYSFFFLHTLPSTIVFKLEYALLHQFYAEISTLSIKKYSVRLLSTTSWSPARGRLTLPGIKRKYRERVKITVNSVGCASQGMGQKILFYPCYLTRVNADKILVRKWALKTFFSNGSVEKFVCRTRILSALHLGKISRVRHNSCTNLPYSWQRQSFSDLFFVVFFSS